MSSHKERYSFTKTILRVIPMQFRSTPWLNIACQFFGMAQMLMLAYSVVVTQKLFDAIANVAVGKADFKTCLIPLVMLAGTNIGYQIMDWLAMFMIETINGKSAGKIKTFLHRKLQRIDASYFEDSDFLNDLNKAMEGVLAIPYFSLTFFATIFAYGLYFILIGAYLFSSAPVLISILLLSFIPTLLAQVVRAKVYVNLEEQSGSLRRESEYYQRTLGDREYFKETRLLGAYKFFYQLFLDSIRLLTDKTWKAGKKTTLIELALNFSTFAGMAVAVYMLFTAIMSGTITIGTFVAIFYGLGSIFNIMQEIISIQAGNMSRDVGKINNFIRMLDMVERGGTTGKFDFSKGIVVENASFSYPGRANPSIEDICLSISDGEIIAVVGENGAGKSTLVRLLTGIFRPLSGKVIVGGLNTAIVSSDCIFEGISGVFQKYQRYKMTLGENVSISDTKTAPNVTKSEHSLTEAGYNGESMSLDIMLSPEFGGIDLSGGQWQRVAIARGLYRTSGFIVLDEPTAALDPIEEKKLYQQFQQLAKGKCAVVVTHRLGSAKLAHRIVVMDGGKITDIGTHEELLARNGKYLEMWKAQAQWYIRENDL